MTKLDIVKLRGARLQLVEKVDRFKMYKIRSQDERLEKLTY